jgi:hypothetical protein
VGSWIDNDVSSCSKWTWTYKGREEQAGRPLSFGGTLALSFESDLLTSFILLRSEYFDGPFVIIFFSQSRDDVSQQHKTSTVIVLYFLVFSCL